MSPSADVECRGLTYHKLHLLEDLELLDDGYAIPRPSNKDSLLDILPDELILLLRTLALSPQQLEQQKSKKKPSKPSLGQTEANFLQKAVQLKQSQYGTTIAEDQEHLARLSQSGTVERSSRRQKMAIQVRIGEKEILHRLSSMLDGLVKPGVDGLAAKRSANGDGTELRKAKSQKT